MSRYDPEKIEKKWQQRWLREKIYEPDFSIRQAQDKPRAKKPFYNLMMFPYPSAEGLHIGGMRTFTGVDIYGRMKRMQGHDVFEPIGLDGFGIHSENYALKIGKHPVEHAKDSEKNFYRQLAAMGNGFAWDERLETYDPGYYKWTQWIFVQMFKRGLAYRKKSPVNWCPSCKTVLADEQVLQDDCERCSTKVLKKELEQWFFKITDYAERLLKNLEKINWDERIKIAQRNWIGKSEGALLEFKIKDSEFGVEVFTTRPDTLFGATYMVLGPENELIAKCKAQIANYDEVSAYVKIAKTKTNEDRIADGREKTGVELKGIKAINPANNEEIPVWVADYVLGNVGTGAIMAVPAHDQRDFELAKKFGLPIREVIVPNIIDRKNPPVPGKKTIERNNVHAIVRDPSTDKYLVLKWKKIDWTTFPMGGVNYGEDVIGAARREVMEETGFVDLKFVRVLEGRIRAEYFATHKNENRVAYTTAVMFDLIDYKRKEISEEEKNAHEIIWLDKARLNYDNMTHAEVDLWMKKLNSTNAAYTGEGILVNSGQFSGVDSEKAKWEVTEFVGGQKKINYRLRDWLVSRQRYWGPPIPMIFCEACAKKGRGGHNKEYYQCNECGLFYAKKSMAQKCQAWCGEHKSCNLEITKHAIQDDSVGNMPGWYAVFEKDLPIRLPHIKEFRPTGTDKSPLATVEKFYKARCPKCRYWARRETDVSDAFLDSAWYYLRYPSVRDKKNPWNNGATKRWLPVHSYIGGAEHSVLHLLYSRFLAMVFYDWEMLHFEEPFTTFRAHGLITKDGAKMSKSKGNAVNPDDYIKVYGADVMRMYLAFLAPLTQDGDFRDAGIRGITRFLERAWRLSDMTKDEIRKMNPSTVSHSSLNRIVHQTIKKVTEDIESLQYNTAISALMTLLNKFEEMQEGVTLEQNKVFLRLLAPFAPHLAEELWQKINKLKKFASIHKESWPKYDLELVQEDAFELIIQVNGKVRGWAILAMGSSEEEAKRAALAQNSIKKYMTTEPRKIIFVPNKLINFVV